MRDRVSKGFAVFWWVAIGVLRKPNGKLGGGDGMSTTIIQEPPTHRRMVWVGRDN